MRIIFLAIMLTISGLSNAQQKSKYYYRRTLVMGDKAFDQMVANFNKRIQDASPKEDSTKAGLSPQQIAQMKEQHQMLAEQPLTTQEVYTIEKGEVIVMPEESYVLKFNLEKGIYKKGYRFVEKGKEAISFDPTEQELNKVVATFKKTDSLQSINDYECVLFLLTIHNQEEPNPELATENVMVWATRSIQPVLPIQALLMLKNPVKEMEQYTPVLLSNSPPFLKDAKEVIVLETVN